MVLPNSAGISDRMPTMYAWSMLSRPPGLSSERRSSSSSIKRPRVAASCSSGLTAGRLPVSPL